MADNTLRTSIRADRSAARRQRSTTSERAGPRRDILATEVLDKAAALFSQRGFAATSLQDVAERVGLSRTSIYYYFDSKDALLQELVGGVTRQATQIFDDLDAAPGPSPAADIATAARRLVNWVNDPHTHFKLVDRSEHELPPATAAVHRKAKRRVVAGMRSLIEAGIAAGEFRAVDSAIAAFTIIGMCNWTAWWFRPGGEQNLGSIADSIAEQAVASLSRSPAAPSATDLRSLTNAIRNDLELIDRLHASKDET